MREEEKQEWEEVNKFQNFFPLFWGGKVNETYSHTKYILNKCAFIHLLFNLFSSHYNQIHNLVASPSLIFLTPQYSSPLKIWGGTASALPTLSLISCSKLSLSETSTNWYFMRFPSRIRRTSDCLCFT